LFLGKQIGIVGVVLSSLLLATINAIWAPIQCRKIINRTAKGVWNE
jgi:hypothetical protein